MTLDFDILAWLVGFLILALLLIVHWRKQRDISYLLCFTIFWIYIMFVVKETIFPIPFSGDMVDMMKKDIVFMSRVNLIPLNFGKFAFISAEGIIINSVLNIILTMPFGFGVSFIAHVKTKDFWKLAILVGLTIESTQLAISLVLGFPYRTIDINDVIMNAIGVLLGYGFFRIFAWLYVTLTQRLGIKHKGLSAYVFDVVSNIGH